MPPIPSWDGLHPLVIHFPIALLLAAPILLILAIVISKHSYGIALGAFALILLGTIASLVSISTGEAAAELADRTPAINALIEHHEDLAEQVRLVFIALTVVLGLLLLAPIITKKSFTRGMRVFGLTAMVVFVLAGDALIIKTAHQGGLLVHEYGVHAMVASSGADTGSPYSIETETD
jgi:uncharacterized membrane protein